MTPFHLVVLLVGVVFACLYPDETTFLVWLLIAIRVWKFTE